MFHFRSGPFRGQIPFSISCALLLVTSLAACRAPMAAPGPGRPVSLRAQQAGVASWYRQLSPELQSYYAPVQHLQGRELFEGLSTLVNQAKALNYGEATAYLYTQADSRLQGKTPQIRAAYSAVWISGDGPSGHKYKEDGDANGDGKNGDSINCEHTWPQGFFDKQEPMRSDMHHLFPTLMTPNTRRGHFPLDNRPADGEVTYATASGSQQIKTRQSAWGYVFEPGVDQKGDSARALLYFYLRYYKAPIRQNEYRPDFFFPRLRTYQQWMVQDPVNAVEAHRHERIAQAQGNRNPFVDIPQLLDVLGPETLSQMEAAVSG